MTIEGKSNLEKNTDNVDAKSIKDLDAAELKDPNLLKDIQDPQSKENKKSEKKESKEIITKSLEFEKETFKIDNKGWEEEERNMNPNRIHSVKVKVNATGDVLEYLEGPMKGEQLFIGYDAFIRELCNTKNCSKQEAEKKYLMTVDEIKEKMKDKTPYSQEYSKFFDEEIKGKLAGYWYPDYNSFNGLGSRYSVWLVGGKDVGFSKSGWECYSGRDYFGFSGRLLKN